MKAKDEKHPKLGDRDGEHLGCFKCCFMVSLEPRALAGGWVGLTSSGDKALTCCACPCLLTGHLSLTQQPE